MCWGPRSQPGPRLKDSCEPAGASVEKLGEAAACAVKRIHLDTRMIHKARDTGAELREKFEVTSDGVAFDAASGLWSVPSTEVRHPDAALQLGAVPASAFRVFVQAARMGLLMMRGGWDLTHSSARLPEQHGCGCTWCRAEA